MVERQARDLEVVHTVLQANNIRTIVTSVIWFY